MKKRSKKTHSLRVAVNVLFLALFIGLTVTGKIQIWFVLFLLGVLISFRWGRFYCGWVCPMFTLARPVAWLHKKLKIRPLRLPPPLQRPVTRYVVLALFIALLVLQQERGMHLPVLPALTALSVLFVLIFEEKWWHSRICPFGTILELSSRTASRGQEIAPAACIACGICDTRCPTDAIEKLPPNEKGKSKRKIVKERCLNCYNCVVACPTRTIGYGRLTPPYRQTQDAAV